MSEKFVEVRKIIMERLQLIQSLGGEWNDGYAQGLNFAASIIYEEIRKEQKLNSYHQEHGMHVKISTNPIKFYNK
jgi:hypothetical protein